MRAGADVIGLVERLVISESGVRGAIANVS